jgi:glucose-1-phosphate thymidylyltransferase
MEIMIVVVFEDKMVDQLAPVTTARPAFAISCGSNRLVNVLAGFGLPMRHLVRPHLREIQRLDFPDSDLGDCYATASARGALLVNARLVPTTAVRQQLHDIIATGRPGIIPSGDSIAAAVLGPQQATQLDLLDASAVTNLIGRLELPTLAADLLLFEYAHEIVKYHLERFPEDLRMRIADGDYAQHADGVFLAPGARIAGSVEIDVRDGPIVLESEASVGPFCCLRGPMHLGRGATVKSHANIKSHVAAGHTTRIGGEVSCTIVEPYSNKSHHGYLGHSYVGSWVNLGAGTTNSNLKNTYGDIAVDYNGTRIPTGMQFLGCIIGDYVKTAINTSIFTGKTIGFASNLYGMITRNVPALVNYAHSLGQVSEVSADAAIKTQDRMFARRRLTPRNCDAELIKAVHEMTREERRRWDPDMKCGPPMI